MTSIEYALIAALISVVIAGAVHSYHDNVRVMYNMIADSVAGP